MFHNDERVIMQGEVEKTYDTFISHISDGRGLSKDLIDSIGQGRVWSGVDAKRLGLVDVLGGLNDAIEIAAKKAGLATYRTIALPEQKEFIEELVEDLNSEAKTYFLKQQLGENYKYYLELDKIVNEKGIMARMPEKIEIR